MCAVHARAGRAAGADRGRGDRPAGPGRWERSEDRSGTRNGSRSRTVSTPAGDVEVKVPKLRKGSFFPDLLEPRRRVDRALWGG
jgi:transposase-like protein